MAWNGSGSFDRTKDWTDDRDANIKILATRHDENDDELTVGIGACLTKNNESKPTADFSPNASATYDLGSSGLKWKDLFLSGLASVATLVTTGAATIGGLLTLSTGSNIASATTVDLTAATGNLVHITGTTTTTGFTMTSGQQMELVADAAWPLTYNATTMNINGGDDYTCVAGDRLFVFYDGTTTYVNITKSDGTAVRASSIVRLRAANGFGSTNTKIRRFLTTVNNLGSDITYADSATLGGSFTINADGIYAVHYTDQFNAADWCGVSLNTATPAANLSGLPIAEVVAGAITTVADFPVTASSAIKLSAGDVIRAHTNAGAAGTSTNFVQFAIARVG